MKLLTFCVAAIVVLMACDAEDVDYCPDKPLDIVMVMDTSKSIDKNELKTLFSSVAAVASGFNIGKGPGEVRVAGVGFGYEAETYFDFNAYTDVDSLVAAFNSLGRVEAYKGTRTDRGLEEMMKLFDDPASGSRSHSTHVGIVYTDGRSTNEIKLAEVIATLPKNMRRYSVGIGDGIHPDELEFIAESDIEHVFYAHDFDDLQDRLVEDIIDEVKCPCDPICKQGLCNATTGECDCPPGFTGDDCSVPCTKYGDVMMVVDCSNSLNEKEYKQVRKYAASVVEELAVSDAMTRVGVVKFGEDVDIEINLDDNNDKDFIANKLLNMERPAKYRATNTSHALWKALEMFEEQGRNPLDFDRKIVLVTDGRATDRTYLRDAVEDLIDAGIVRFVVGAGITGTTPQQYESAMKELHFIAGRDSNLILSPSTAALQEFTEELIQAINLCAEDI